MDKTSDRKETTATNGQLSLDAERVKISLTVISWYFSMDGFRGKAETMDFPMKFGVVSCIVSRKPKSIEFYM